MIARSGGIYRRRSAALFDENVRIEARQITGDQRPVFANTDPAGWSLMSQLPISV